MLPKGSAEIAPRRERMGRIAFLLNGALFLISAYDGYDTGSPPWLVYLFSALGAILVAAFARSRRSTLPERLPHGLAAAGLFASAVAVAHHRTGLPYAYALAGILNLLLCVFGKERITRIVRRG